MARIGRACKAGVAWIYMERWGVEQQGRPGVDWLGPARRLGVR